MSAPTGTRLEIRNHDGGAESRLVLPEGMALNIQAHALEYCDGEVCGMIGGRFDGEGRLALLLARTANRAADPTKHFRIEPYEQYQITNTFHEKGHEFIGIYHSHVTGEARPSLNDLSTIPSSLFSLIYSVRSGQLRGWVGRDPVDLEVGA